MPGLFGATGFRMNKINLGHRLTQINTDEWELLNKKWIIFGVALVLSLNLLIHQDFTKRTSFWDTQNSTEKFI